MSARPTFRSIPRVHGLAIAGLLALAGPAIAQPAPAAGPTALTVALYTPTAAFSGVSDRVDYADRLAAQIQAQTHLPTTGLAFVHAGDLESAVRKHLVDFAVLDPTYEAVHLGDFPVLAAALVHGQTTEPWALLAAHPGVSLRDLAGKRLVIVAVGRADRGFLENALLSGEVAIDRYFAKGPVVVPDVSSAVQTVTLGRADVLLAPEGQAGSLSKVFEIPGIPTAAFVQIDRTLPRGLVEKVQAAVISYGGGGGFGGWTASGSRPYEELAAAMGAREKPVVLDAPGAIRLDASSVLRPLQWSLPMPDLGDQLWVPALPATLPPPR